MTRLLTLACVLAALPALREGEAFARDESDIVAVSLDDQAQALKTKAIKRGVGITEVIKVLTTYRVVTREQYLIYDHTVGVACGSASVKGGGTCLWAIEPGYAAVVTPPRGGEVYLLHPDLKVTRQAGQ